MFRPCFLVPQTFDATHAFSTSAQASEMCRVRLVQTGAVNPADAANSEVCIPMAVTLFLWE